MYDFDGKLQKKYQKRKTLYLFVKILTLSWGQNQVLLRNQVWLNNRFLKNLRGQDPGQHFNKCSDFFFLLLYTWPHFVMN